VKQIKHVITKVNPNWTTKNKPEKKGMSWGPTYVEGKQSWTSLPRSRGKP